MGIFFHFLFIFKSGNRVVAHGVAHFALSINILASWNLLFSDWLLPLIRNDIIE